MLRFSHVDKSHVNMGFFSQHGILKKSHVNMEHLFLMLGSLPSKPCLPPSRDLGSPHLGMSNYVEFIDTIFTDVEGVD